MTLKIFNSGAEYQTPEIATFKASSLTQQWVEKITFDLAMEVPFSGFPRLSGELMDKEINQTEIVESLNSTRGEPL